MIRALIFDYFGVIRPDGVYAAYRHLGGDPDKDAQFIHDTIGALNRGLIPSSLPVFAEHLGVSTEEWKEAVTGRYKHDETLLAYIKQLRHDYKIGLLSNIGPGGLETLWEPGELDVYFDVAIASGDVGMVKPDPGVYRLIAERLGVQPDECVMIDDREVHCDGARQIGMQAILYEHFAQGKHDIEQLLQQQR